MTCQKPLSLLKQFAAAHCGSSWLPAPHPTPRATAHDAAPQESFQSQKTWKWKKNQQVSWFAFQIHTLHSTELAGRKWKSKKENRQLENANLHPSTIASHSQDSYRLGKVLVRTHFSVLLQCGHFMTSTVACDVWFHSYPKYSQSHFLKRTQSEK